MSVSRVVVAARLPGALRLADRPAEALARLTALVERAEALGGVVAAFGFDLVAFAFDESGVREAVGFAVSVAHAPALGDPAWACGVASGELHLGKIPANAGAPLEWGAPLAQASALARVARVGEVLVDVSVPEIVSRELLTDRARVGKIAGKRVRGFRLDRRQPWRAVAAGSIARVVEGPLLGRDTELARLLAATDVIVLRADSGLGGSRLLAEVAARTKPSRSITLTPFAVVHEPLGSLRRAMAFVAATERITLPPKLHPVLDRLLGAEGVSVEDAALLIAHQIQRRPGAPLPSLLLDDAADIDEPSLEACARAVELLGGGVRVVARVDSTSKLPRTLLPFAGGDEVVLERLDAEYGQALAGACTGGSLEESARVQWTRRGGGSPLGILEAILAGVSKGELVWAGDVLAPLKRTSGDEIARTVGYWISKRAEDLRDTSLDVLIALAHFAGEASSSELEEVMTEVAPEVDLRGELRDLTRDRWVRETRPGTYGLVTRAQREAILEFSRNAPTRDWRGAVAKTLERADGTLRRAEAAQHAARAGMGEWASRLAMAAARTAAAAGLEEAASSLAAFAGMQDPQSDDLDLGSLTFDEDATLAAGVDALVLEDEVDAAEGTSVRAKLVGETGADDEASLEEASGEVAFLDEESADEPSGEAASGQSTLREAARDLRETRWAAVARRGLALEAAPALRRRGLLALARACADEGRSAEALLHGLDALARMREGKDERGARTCLLFLARLYERTDRLSDAATLRNAAATM